VAAALALAREAAAVVRGDDLLGTARELQAKTLALLARAEAAGDLRTALAAVREARGNLELLGRLAGQLEGARRCGHHRCPGVGESAGRDPGGTRGLPRRAPGSGAGARW